MKKSVVVFIELTAPDNRKAISAVMTVSELSLCIRPNCKRPYKSLICFVCDGASVIVLALCW